MFCLLGVTALHGQEELATTEELAATVEHLGQELLQAYGIPTKKVAPSRGEFWPRQGNHPRQRRLSTFNLAPDSANNLDSSVDVDGVHSVQLSSEGGLDRAKPRRRRVPRAAPVSSNKSPPPSSETS